MKAQCLRVISYMQLCHVSNYKINVTGIRDSYGNYKKKYVIKLHLLIKMLVITNGLHTNTVIS